MGGKYCHCTGKCLTLPMEKDEACLRPIVTPTSPVFFQNKKNDESRLRRNDGPDQAIVEPGQPKLIYIHI